ncbi:MAG: MFS transporter [Planctomycetes bacterium]|nr:MFS transporter [Planctomycetota bacterium]
METAKTGNFGKWMALIAALLGWLFDGAEMGLFSMVGRAAIQDLMGFGTSPTKEQEGLIAFYFGIVIAVFLVGAATGGVLFGWLGDRIGRVRAMSLSVLTYALFTGLCGLVKRPEQIAVLRFIAALGMGGEWSLGVALVMEVWPNRSRGLMAGLIGAAANVGYFLVGIVGLGLNRVLETLKVWLLATGLAENSVDALVAFKGWRLMMLLGCTPALLTFFFRVFVPESHKWEQEKGSGSTSHWQTRDLLGVLIGAIGPGLIVFVWAWKFSNDWSSGEIAAVRIAGSVVGLAIATYGYLWPVRRYVARYTAERGAPTAMSRKIIGRMLLAAGLSGIALMGTWASTQSAPNWADKLTGGKFNSREYTQIFLALGACFGTIVAALAGDKFGRRIVYCLMCIMSLASALWLFNMNSEYGEGWSFLTSVFIAGACTASFYGWLPLYLPELFETNVRATGQGFGFNFGRILAAVGALQGGVLNTMFPNDQVIFGMTFKGGYPLACSTMSLIYLIGIAFIWLAPETKGQPLPE